ncbi:hypothetical protein AAC387_Pa02g1882 [Persea americana]
MIVAEHPPHKRKLHSFDVTRHQAVVRPVPTGAQAIMPTAKGTLVEPSRGTGLVIHERSNPRRSHYQMMLRPSDSITAEILPVTSVKTSREKGLLYTNKWKNSKSSLATARRASPREVSAALRTMTCVTRTEKARKSNQRADSYHEESTELDSPGRDWKRIPRVQTERNPSTLDAGRFALQSEQSLNEPLSGRGSITVPTRQRNKSIEEDCHALMIKSLVRT